MSLWGDVQKSVSKSTKVGLKQTGKWIEIGKLNMELTAANLGLQNLYEQIGEYIYTYQVKNVTGDSKLSELLQKVYVQKAKIKSIQDKIVMVRSINACENCKQELEVGTKYCPYCSHPQSKEVDFQI